MATKKKMLQAAAGNAGGGGPLNVEDVFSTYLYTGTGSAQTITNGIDLDGEGGLVWTKTRSVGDNHRLADTERGAGNGLFTDLTSAESSTATCGVDAFYSDGYLSDYSDSYFNGEEIASWTFRKAPKFFDVVTYTGTGGATTVAHNLGTTVGSLIIKRTDTAQNWYVYHRGVNFGATQFPLLLLNTTAAASGNKELINSTEPTDAVFSVASDLNTSGGTYVAYLFAHNDGDGGFGGEADADIIKCGSYSQSSASDVDVDLGFEPQFVIVKRSDDTSQWYILDEMRGFLAGSNSTSSRTLYANLTNAEADFTIQKTATGFTWPSGQYGSGTQEYIYIAIRRGTKVPESATEVFDVYAGSDAYPTVITTGFTVDSLLGALRSGNSNNFISGSRLTGSKSLITSSTAAEGNGLFSGTTNACFMRNDGILPSTFGSSNTVYYSWKRAPGYFDAVAFSGDGVAGRTVSHNLGVAPEMILIKMRSNIEDWAAGVNFTDTNFNSLKLNSSNGATTQNYASLYNYFDGQPTESNITLSLVSVVNGSGEDYIAYLFASLAGVSKVGSYTGNGTSQTIDCGFSSGARFILVKRTDSTGDWYVWDTERGIVAGNDPYLELNTTDAEVTSTDWVDPDNSGFIVNGTTINASSAEYIFYAVS